jgi:hypothetical protein
MLLQMGLGVSKLPNLDWMAGNLCFSTERSVNKKLEYVAQVTAPVWQALSFELKLQYHQNTQKWENELERECSMVKEQRHFRKIWLELRPEWQQCVPMAQHWLITEQLAQVCDDSRSQVFLRVHLGPSNRDTAHVTF